ncbi:16085_t:CDS:2, partial [Gigaspora rosea]
LAEFIIYNSQPLTILSSQKFIAFCQALDAYYQVPNDKVLKCMINEAYLQEKECLKDTHKYLRTIQDVETRWNSSYLSWKHLLKLKDRDPQTQKDSRRLNKIMLNNDEWTVLEKLVKVLGPFVAATDLLGGSTYSTIRFMNPIIALLKKQTENAWLMEINAEELVDLTNEDTALDDIGF